MDHLEWLEIADELPDVFGAPQISPQGQDGTPHLSYYDSDRALSFVWDGRLHQHVNVSHGGAGEPVKWTFDFIELWNYGVPGAIRNGRTPQFTGEGFWSAAYHFKQACENWVMKMEKESSQKGIYTSCFDESNPNWSRDITANYLFLKGVQSHMNHVLQSRGHVFLNDVYDQLGFPRTGPGAIVGWLWEEENSFIDYLPLDYADCEEASVWLKFNVDGVIYEKI